jgi:hypothetical protein
MAGDPFETVAIAYSQAQADVILSLFAWHGIPAYAKNIEHVRADPALTLALGAMPIRVHRDYAGEARGLLDEAAEREIEPMPAEPIRERILKVGFLGLFGFLALAPPPKVSAEIVREA